MQTVQKKGKIFNLRKTHESTGKTREHAVAYFPVNEKKRKNMKGEESTENKIWSRRAGKKNSCLPGGCRGWPL